MAKVVGTVTAGKSHLACLIAKLPWMFLLSVLDKSTLVLGEVKCHSFGVPFEVDWVFVLADSRVDVAEGTTEGVEPDLF